MKRFIYLVYSKEFDDQELVKNSYVCATEDEAWDKMAELNSIIGMPPFIFKKIQIKG